MQYRQLGRSGLRVSQICLGAMVGFTHERFDTAAKVVHEAVELGVNFIDTADVYRQSEEVLGRILSEGHLRDKVMLATKAGWHTGKDSNDVGYSRPRLLAACEGSLRKLRTDRIDLYYLHVVDPNTPMDEVLRTLEMLIRQGKVRYIGTSKHPVALIMEALAFSDRYGLERFICEQCPYNLLDRRAENDLTWMAQRQGIGLVPFYPLAMGLLSGKYGPDGSAQKGGRLARRKLGTDHILTPQALEAVEKLRPIAKDKSVSLAELALAWLMHQPAVTAPTVGARTVEYVRSAVRACDVALSDEDLERIDRIVPPGRCVSDFYDYGVLAALRSNYAPGTKAGAFIPDRRIEPYSGADHDRHHETRRHQ